MSSVAYDLSRVARNLGGEVSGGQVLAPGPNHSSKDRSLAVRLEPDAPEGFVVHSFANDDPLACRDHVRAKAGLPERKPADTGPTPVERKSATRRVAATYDYLDERGEPYLRVLRMEPKSFAQQLWNGRQWVSGKPLGPKVPYRLPAMLAAVHDTVIVCDGEKDADALAARGFIATTASEGAGKWTDDLSQWFKGKTVYVLADNDPAGEAHAESVARSLHAVADEVRVVRLPGIPAKGDVSDWLAANPHPQSNSLIDVCRAAPRFSPDAPSPRKAHRSEFTADELWDMEFPPVSWIVPDYITPGLTLLVGAPKLGKSWLALDICNAVAQGGYTLGDRHCQQGAVLYAALEDPPRQPFRRWWRL